MICERCKKKTNFITSIKPVYLIEHKDGEIEENNSAKTANLCSGCVLLYHLGMSNSLATDFVDGNIPEIKKC